MGGTERVISILANQFCRRGDVEVHLILCSDAPVFYMLDPSVQVHVPDFDYQRHSRIEFTPRLMAYLRRQARKIRPDVLMSFGGRYNSFAIMALAGTGIPVFISERSMPGVSYGFLLNLLNPFVYRFSAGILAQTAGAAAYTRHKTKHRNIRVIGNPIPQFENLDFMAKEHMVLSVGRFISSKNQDKLISMFAGLPENDWHLWLVGDGPTWATCKALAEKSGCADRIHFTGKQANLADWYRRAAIFAFPSESEGFPNALAEAMAAGCVPVSYNCNAGPSDLIRNGENGFLVPLRDETLFMRKLQLLISGRVNWLEMGLAAAQSMKRFQETDIARDTLQFLLDGIKNRH